MLYGNAAHAQQTQASSQSLPSIALAGAMGNKALVVFNNGAPKTMAVGQEHLGVKLLSMQGNKATFQVMLLGNIPRRFSMRVGDIPLSLTSNDDTPTTTTRNCATTVKQEIVLLAGDLGHYYTTGYINNRAVVFMVDTGASYVSMSVQDAEVLGIDYSPVVMQTANGNVTSSKVTLDSIEIQGIRLTDIDAVVSPRSREDILLGNSFLNHFDIERSYNRLVLT